MALYCQYHLKCLLLLICRYALPHLLSILIIVFNYLSSSNNSVSFSYLLSSLASFPGQSISLGSVLIAQVSSWSYFIVVLYGVNLSVWAQHSSLECYFDPALLWSYIISVYLVCGSQFHYLCASWFGGFFTLLSAISFISCMIFCYGTWNFDLGYCLLCTILTYAFCCWYNLLLYFI